MAGCDLLRNRDHHSSQIHLEARCHIVRSKVGLVRIAAQNFYISRNRALNRTETCNIGRMPDDVRAVPNQDRGGLSTLGGVVIISRDYGERSNSRNRVLRSSDEGSFHPLLVGIVVASDKAHHQFLIRNERSQDTRAVGCAEVTHIDEHNVVRDIGFRKESSHKIILGGIIGRYFKQGAAKFDTVANDQIETVIRVASRDLVHLGKANVLSVGRLESVSRLEFLQAVVSQLAPATIRNNSRKQQNHAGFSIPISPCCCNRRPRESRSECSIEDTPRYSAHPLLPREFLDLINTAKPIQILKASEPRRSQRIILRKRRPSPARRKSVMLDIGKSKTDQLVHMLYSPAHFSGAAPIHALL